MLRPDTRKPRRGQELVDQLIDLAIMVGLVVLILVGFVTSYRTLLDLAVTAGGYPRWLAPAVPLSFDLGIVVLSLKVARSAREGRTAPVMRLLVAGLSTATVLANASAAGTPAAKLLHAVPPAMFVICFESVVISARRRALVERALLPSPLPRMRTAQWVLAPGTTWRCWRSQVLGQQPVSAQVVTARARVGAMGERVSAKPSNKPPIQGHLTWKRSELVEQLLAQSPSLTAGALQGQLKDQGHSVSLRTAQRLLAAART